MTMARVPNAEIQETRVTSEPLAELPVPPSRRGYGEGDVIDGHRLEARIGAGGMGEVWTARNDTLGVRRAVKLIRADSGNAESTDRLLHEARAAARLADPAIVRVFDFGRTEHGDPFIVMELLEGEDLMSIISRRERLSPVKAVRVLLPVVRALSAAHEHGIVHRDLKPENIFLTRLADGRVQPKLLDFGIAKLKNARDLRLTSAGSVMGSPLYMAPEQARGEDVDERADIWAVCVVLYEAMTGQTPFPGDDRASVMHAVATVEPEHPSKRGVLEPVPWPIIVHGLEKQRDERWRSMDELGRELARWLLANGVTEDITGASLEAGWLRDSRRSVFASSLPPERSLSRKLSHTRRWVGEWRRHVHVVLQWLENRNLPLWRRVAALDPRRRWALFVSMGVVIALALLWLGARSPAAVPAVSATHPTPLGPAAPAPAASAPTQAAPAPAALAAAAEPPRVETAALPAPAVAPRSAARSSKTRRPSARKAAPRPASEPPRETATRARRAKLIDPYQ
jgi:eukaryotic-like serine/threonine-protein kinase